MNKQLYLQSNAKKYINHVDIETKMKEFEAKDLSLEQIQDLVEIETRKLTELLSLSERNLHDKTLQLEYMPPLKHTSPKNTIITVLNEILLDESKNERKQIVDEQIKDKQTDKDKKKKKKVKFVN